MTDVNLNAALRIDGWMSEAELRWLATVARSCWTIVEIGSWLGRSARALADNMPVAGLLYCVDKWDGMLAPGLSGGGWTPETCYAAFLKHMKGCRFETFRVSSLEAATYFQPGHLDMIFIDADHSYDAVKADILAWKPLLAPGGVLCGHDFSKEFDGVRRAVAELLPGFQLGPGWLWYWREANAGR